MTHSRTKTHVYSCDFFIVKKINNLHDVYIRNNSCLFLMKLYLNWSFVMHRDIKKNLITYFFYSENLLTFFIQPHSYIYIYEYQISTYLINSPLSHDDAFTNIGKMLLIYFYLFHFFNLFINDLLQPIKNNSC